MKMGKFNYKLIFRIEKRPNDLELKKYLRNYLIEIGFPTTPFELHNYTFISDQLEGIIYYDEEPVNKLEKMLEDASKEFGVNIHFPSYYYHK